MTSCAYHHIGDYCTTVLHFIASGECALSIELCLVFNYLITCSTFKLRRSWQQEIDLIWPNPFTSKPPYSTLSDQEVQVDTIVPQQPLLLNESWQEWCVQEPLRVFCACWSSRTVGSTLFVILRCMTSWWVWPCRLVLVPAYWPPRMGTGLRNVRVLFQLSPCM